MCSYICSVKRNKKRKVKNQTSYKQRNIYLNFGYEEGVNLWKCALSLYIYPISREKSHLTGTQIFFRFLANPNYGVNFAPEKITYSICNDNKQF